MLGDRAQVFQVTLMSVVLEPIRILHSFFLQIGHGAIDCTRLPPTFDLIWRKRSIYWQVLQYYSACLQCLAPHLRLLWQAHSCVSAAEWSLQHPEEAALRGLGHPAAEHDTVVDEPRGMRACCLQCGVARTLRKAGVGANDM